MVNVRNTTHLITNKADYYLSGVGLTGDHVGLGKTGFSGNLQVKLFHLVITYEQDQSLSMSKERERSTQGKTN